MDKFRVEVLSAMANPQQVIWAAMHQDYSEGFVCDQRDRFPDETKAGELIIKHLLQGNRGHFGPIEHPQIVFNVGFFPHSTMQQLRTHRVGISFDVQCLAGATEITFVNKYGESSKKHKKTIAELYELWTNGEHAIRDRRIKGRQGEAPGIYRRDCKKRLQKMRLRVLNEETGKFEFSHLKNVMRSGLQPVYRLTLDNGRFLDCTVNHRLLTPKGWKTMEQALNLVTDDQGEVLSMDRDSFVLCNGIPVEASVPVYKNEQWLREQVERGLDSSQIARLVQRSPKTIRLWLGRYGLTTVEAPRGRKLGGVVKIRNTDFAVYRDRNWLITQLDAGKYADEMAQMAGCSVEAIKKWVYHHGLSLNKKTLHGRDPWNKNNGGYQLQLSEQQRQEWRERSRESTCRGEASNFWRGGISEERVSNAAWTRQIAPQIHSKFDYTCQSCGQRGGILHAHHLVPVFANPDLAYEIDNLVTLCKSCHEAIHHNHREAEFAIQFQQGEPLTGSWQPKPKPPGNVLKAHAVRVIAVEYLGVQMTYDLEVEEPWHNFVANGVVVHNSFRYTGDRLAQVARADRSVEEVFYLRPVGFYNDRQGKKYFYSPEQRQADLEWCLAACQHYKQRIDEGLAEEQARGIIPFDVRQHFVMSCNARSLMHILDLRAKADAQLEIQKLCELLLGHFRVWMPEIAAWYETHRLGKARLSP